MTALGEAMLSLGRSRREDEAPVELPMAALLRHMMAPDAEPVTEIDEDDDDDDDELDEEDEAKTRFTQRFEAVPSRVSDVFVPLWRLLLRVGTGEGFRVVTIDGLAGRPVQWP